jgi:hypothetical protein
LYSFLSCFSEYNKNVIYIYIFQQQPRRVKKKKQKQKQKQKKKQNEGGKNLIIINGMDQIGNQKFVPLICHQSCSAM